MPVRRYEVLHPASHRQALEWLLVLDAMGIRHRLVRDEESWRIVLHREDAGTAREQLALYGRENLGWPPPEPVAPPDTQRSGWSSVWVAGMLTALYAWFGPYNPNVAVLRHAACDLSKVRDGEWWRVVSAMGVHADALHLGANVAFILAFGWRAARTFGGGLAWSGTLLAAACANVLGVLIFAPPRVSIGASTATFALLGMLAGRRLGAIARARRADVAAPPTSIAPNSPPASWRHNLILYGAVLSLFVMLGVDPETDVLGHFAGLVFGVPVGFLLGHPNRPRLPELAQRLLELATVALFFWSWRLALGAGVSP